MKTSNQRKDNFNKEINTLPYECFRLHEQYMEQKGFSSCIPEWWAMYEGKQLPDDYSDDLPRAMENICSWVVDSKHATILGTTTTLNFTCFDKTISTDALKKFDEYQQKAIKMEAFKDKVVLDSLVGASGFLYHYWNENANFIRGKSKGSLCLDTIQFEDFFCSNPRLDNLQKQKYVGFRRREEVKAVRELIDKNIENYEEIISNIVPDDYLEKRSKYDNDITALNSGLVTTYTRFFRIDGEVYWERSTKSVNLVNPTALNPDITEKELKNKLKKKRNDDGYEYSPDDMEIYEIDPEIPSFQDNELEKSNSKEYADEKEKMSLYPICILSLKPRRNCLYGRSEIEDVEDNQRIINFNIAMIAKEVQDTAWATIIMKDGAANGQTWTGSPGGVFIDYTPGNSFGIKRLEGNQLNSGVMQYVINLIDITKMITGTNELVSSESGLKDVTAYALQILEEQRNKKIEILQNRYWRFLVECAEIRLQFYKHYYPESYYLINLTDAEYQEEKQIYDDFLKHPEQIINFDNRNITKGEAAQIKGEPLRYQRKSVNPKEEWKGHIFDIVCESGKGTKYSEIIDADLINTLFLNGGYDKMTTDAFEMWLTLNPLLSESRKVDIKILLEKQKASENSQLKQMNAQLEQMLQTALSRVKQLEAIYKQQGLYAKGLEENFARSMNAAKEQVDIRERELNEIRKSMNTQPNTNNSSQNSNRQTITKMPSVEEMIRNG